MKSKADTGVVRKAGTAPGRPPSVKPSPGLIRRARVQQGMHAITRSRVVGKQDLG